jgi:hypothetical protein
VECCNVFLFEPPDDDEERVFDDVDGFNWKGDVEVYGTFSYLSNFSVGGKTAETEDRGTQNPKINQTNQPHNWTKHTLAPCQFYWKQQ